MSDFSKNNFDLIRLLAAGQVAFLHAIEHFGVAQTTALGKLINVFPGVPIFFITSGFLISASWQRSHSVSQYAVGRVLRIFPALWVCLFFSVFSSALVYSYDTSFADFFTWILAQSSMLQYYNPDFLRGYGVGVLNGSLWTIPIELQFYIALPLLFVFFNRIVNSNVLLVIAIAAFAFIAYAANHLLVDVGVPHTYLRLFGATLAPSFYFFLIGIFLNQNFVVMRRLVAGRFTVILAAYLLTILAASYAGVDYSGNDINPVLIPGLAVLLLSFAYTKPGQLNKLAMGVDLSYGLYIYHMVVINFLLHTALLSGWIGVAVALSVSLLLACFSWLVVEKPCLALKAKLIGRERPVRAVPAPAVT